MILLDSIAHDFRQGLRLMARHPGATIVTVFALAVGISVNTAVFTVYQAMVARPLDARDPASMVSFALQRDSGATEFRFSHSDYEAYRDQNTSLRGLVAFRPAHFTLSHAGSRISQRSAVQDSGIGKLGIFPAGASNVEYASVAVVSENYFRVLDITLLAGRSFEPGGAPTVLISENYWQRRFAGDPAILGKTIHLNGIAVSIIGITPHNFVGTGINAPAFWVPLGLDPLLQADPQWLRNRDNHPYRLFGRLAPGAQRSQTQAELTRITHDLEPAAASPATALVWPGSPFPLPLSYYGGLQLVILLLMISAGMVLAVACANVGSLQLARARSRQSELRTRLSLGASRLRVIRQLMTENTSLGLLAGLCALCLTWALLRWLANFSATALPVEFGGLIFDVTPNLAIFAYVVGISLLAGMLSGLAPALESSGVALSSAMRSTTASIGSRRLQDILVAVQVALSLVLLLAGTLLIRRSLHSLESSDRYASHQLIDIEIQFPENARPSEARKRSLMDSLRTRLAALPGVTVVTSAETPEVVRHRAALPVESTKTAPSTVETTEVQPNYFECIGLPLVLGRSFQSTGEVILSEAVAKQLWPGQNPLGRQLRLAAPGDRSQNFLSAPSYEVVGVARDKREPDLDGNSAKEIYFPLPVDQFHPHSILVRTHADPAALLQAIDRMSASFQPDLVLSFSTFEEMRRHEPLFLIASLAAAVASLFGFFGLLLAVMGIYATVSYIVVLRTREVGIRMAVGAQQRDVLRLILQESSRPVLVGLLGGIVLASAVASLAHRLLLGLISLDPLNFGAVSLLFFLIALLAAYPPARRAMRVDPMVALRYE
ncbi:ABC transporter permease [Bryobacter aggregatus]|uniref:ABC transporter permease n=1 Tax=Bryobacter aggregatus TaxID=360054 RepID=UPI0004E250F4|nr:ABC transporter permease [Bryobacter aggregatus]